MAQDLSTLAEYRKCCTSGARTGICLAFQSNLLWLCFSSGSVKPRKEELRMMEAAVLPEYIMMNVGLTPLGCVQQGLGTVPT